MDQEKIKEIANDLYMIIKSSEEKLKTLRSMCKHPNKVDGNYSWRPGSIQPAVICSDCGEVLAIDYGFATAVRKGLGED